ncbi:glucans biosynthesis glucosyltransferase MdoH [Puniceibacterium sediminis]|uniref:Glucans biosynthesis glucosyltransferase H n=1 Tax=Puniceibacterium sediminis TaxID=1608407 RepID=A0A238WV03_9RHOB|nr:glucans biosynthesis glucosyltransferase MdoH [Puniceibacterium sediminis]SNR50273.1 membrane glycosyltransferase [Puniceibacterium sediminis]
MSIHVLPGQIAAAPVRAVLRPAPLRRFLARPVLNAPTLSQAGDSYWLAWLQAAMTLTLTMMIAAGFAAAIDEWTLASGTALALLTLTAATLSLGATTALIGLLASPMATVRPLPGWQPIGRTAVLLTMCGEEPSGPARMLSELAMDLERQGINHTTTLFVLSDTRDPDRIALEEETLAPLIDAGQIVYRRRTENTGRKPGNISDWLHSHGNRFDYMMTLDADSRMGASRIATMVERMERSPQTGLLQAGMRLVPAKSRFGKLQRLSARLMGPTFLTGFALWTGDAGNYWGHNALIRVKAFREAGHLPKLSGSAPFGGDILSHDFVEAALMRRAGWKIEIDAETRASAEDGPQTLAEFHKRDRRWCQGNLQHSRIIGMAGLHPISRMHMAVGIMGYAAGPIWLALVILLSAGLVPAASIWPLLAVVTLLLMPKVCGLLRNLGSTNSPRARKIMLRAATAELVMSSLLAPIVMIRHVLAVGSVLTGHDCGWKSTTGRRVNLPSGMLEAAGGIALVALVAVVNPDALLFMLPVAAPLLAAPILVPYLDRQHDVHI